MSPVRRRLGVLLGAAIVAATVAVGAAVPAAAESISDFTVEAIIGSDTTMRITETITYDFEGEYRHGIFRDIPRYDETLAGQRRTYRVGVDAVTMDGAPVPWVTSDNGPYLNVRIGDPYVTITGPHTYVATYTVADGLRVITEADMDDPLMPDTISAGDVEVFWDWVGTGWDVPIARATATVTGPGDVLHHVCYSGEAGGRATCLSAAVGPMAIYGPARVSPGDAFTGVTVFPAAAFVRAPTENVTQGLPSNPALGFLLAIVPAGLLIAIPVIFAVSRRREDAGVPVPGAPPQYSPPDDLTPAEMAAAWRGNNASGDSRVLVATLLHLASRRWLDVSLMGSDLHVQWTGHGTDPLRPWEESLLGVLLKGQTSATLSGYDSILAADWKLSVIRLVGEAEQVGRRNADGNRPDQRWWWLIAVAFVFVVVGFVSIFAQSAFMATAAWTITVGSVIGFTAARIITPRRETERSARFLAQVRGLEKVLGTDAAASRREFAHRLGLTDVAIFATMLPYAVVLDLEDSWMGAFPDLTPDQLVASGFYVTSMSSLDHLVSSGRSSISSATTAPSSGSGGGGSSGGGGGGGGGGSW